MISLWIKAVARYRQNTQRAEQYLSYKPPSDSTLTERPLVLDLHTPQLLFDSGRHPMCIAMNARLAGSPTYVRCNRLLLGELARKQFGKDLLTDPAVTWLAATETIPDGSFVLTDTPNMPPDLDAGSHCVEMMIGRDIVDGVPVMPYPMHPATLSKLKGIDLSELRSRPKLVQLLFAGRLDSHYGNPRIERAFGVTNRIVMLKTIHQYLGDRVATSIGESSSAKPITLVDSRSHGIAAADWLPTLASTNFFLCCPGAAQPMCHNVIEAMSVGAIPVLEYADRFVPSLQDNVNAICFRGTGRLCDALDRIDQLSAEQVQRIRANVIDHYDRYLRGDQFLRNICNANVAKVSMPFNNKNFFRGGGSTVATRAA